MENGIRGQTLRQGDVETQKGAIWWGGGRNWRSRVGQVANDLWISRDRCCIVCEYGEVLWGLGRSSGVGQDYGKKADG